MTLADREIPTGVQVGTGSYTIPTGKYALVSAQALAGDSFLINGTSALSGSVSTWTVFNGNFPNKSGGGADSTTIAVNSGATGTTGTISFPATARMEVGVTNIYKLPQGTTISGGKWCAQLFDMVTDS